MKLTVNVRCVFEGFSLKAGFHAPMRGITALYGPSGAGKTLIVRAIAGLDRNIRGLVALGDKHWQDETHFLAPHQRSVGMVFQESSLFDHLNVEGNIEFGIRRRPGADQQRIRELIMLLGLDALMQRSASSLSGGERRRVALARALVTEPEILLLDEPLTGLDGARKRDILDDLERIKARLDIPIILVSHDSHEVAELADHLVVLEQGAVVASGALAELATQLDQPLAQATDAASVLAATVEKVDAQWSLTHLETPGGVFLAPGLKLETGRSVRLRIQARDVSLAISRPAQSSILNILPATVREVRSDDQGQVTVQLALADNDQCLLLSRLTARSAEELDLKPGLALFAQVKSVAILA